MGWFESRYYSYERTLSVTPTKTYPPRPCEECKAVYEPVSANQTICGKTECRKARQRKTDARTRARRRMAK